MLSTQPAVIIFDKIANSRAQAPMLSRLASAPRFAPIIQSFLEQLSGRFESGIVRSWEQHDMKALTHTAHWLRGAAGSVGFEAFTSPAGELEDAACHGRAEQIPALIANLSKLVAAAKPATENDTEMNQTSVS